MDTLAGKLVVVTGGGSGMGRGAGAARVGRRRAVDAQAGNAAGSDGEESGRAVLDGGAPVFSPDADADQGEGGGQQRKKAADHDGQDEHG